MATEESSKTLNSNGKHSDKCANCAFEFVEALRTGGKRVGRSSLKENGAKVTSFMAKDENNYVNVQVTEALTEIYKLKWLHLDGNNREEKSKLKLHLCGKCSTVFSQLYDLYTDFNRLRTTGSFLAKISDEIDKLIGDFSSLTEAVSISETGKDGGDQPEIKEDPVKSPVHSEISTIVNTPEGVKSDGTEPQIKKNGIDSAGSIQTNHIEVNNVTSPPVAAAEIKPRRSTRSSTRLSTLSRLETGSSSSNSPSSNAVVVKPKEEEKVAEKMDTPAEKVAVAPAKVTPESQPSEPKKSKPSTNETDISLPALTISMGNNVEAMEAVKPIITNDNILPLRFDQLPTSSQAALNSLINCDDLSNTQLFSSNPNDPYHCPVCGKSFLSEFRLHCHRTYCKSPNEAQVVETPKLKCDLCSFVFASKKSLFRHYQSMHYHHEPPLHSKCGVCGLVFPTLKEKDEHVLSHYRPPPRSSLNGATHTSTYPSSYPSSTASSSTSSSNRYYHHRDVIHNMGTIAVGLVQTKSFNRPFDGTHFLSGVDNPDADEDCFYLVPEVTLEEDSQGEPDFAMGRDEGDDDEDDSDDD